MDSQIDTVSENDTSRDLPRPSPCLTTIPLEVLLQITSNLTTPEYGNLRRACKQIEETLFNAFSREFFTKRQFMLTEFSLQALVDISKSRFSSSLTYVIIGLERPRTCYISMRPGNPLHYEFNTGNRVLEVYLGHMNLVNTSQDVEMLAGAFNKLENLQTIGIRDFNSRSRRRDHPNIEWRSYGTATFERDTGTTLRTPHRLINPSEENSLDHANHLCRIFLSLLRALGKSSPRPMHFEVILKNNSLHDHAFNLPEYIEPSVRPVLANLRTLFLDLNGMFPDIEVHVDNTPTKCQSYFLKRFLSNVTELEHLRLNFSRYENRPPSGNNVLSWLSEKVSNNTSNITSSALVPGPPLPVQFTRLQRLDLGMTRIDPRVLVDIIRKFQATLRIISFHKLSLIDTSSFKAKDGDNLWSKLYAQLSKLDLNLSAINMSFLSLFNPANEHLRGITFKGSRNPPTKKWAGTDVQSGLRDFADHVIVDRLEGEGDGESGEPASEDSDDSLVDVESEASENNDEDD